MKAKRRTIIVGMFKNYRDIAANYVPNNLVCSFNTPKSYTKLDPIQASKPYEEYNTKGELIGYSWYQGETLNLEFNIDGEIVVESDAIIFAAIAEIPTITTKGYVGQRAYNVVDMRSWTCVVSDESMGYAWEEDPEFEHDLENAAKKIYISAADYLSDKKLELRLLNFRFEPIHTQMFAGSSRIIFNIDKELSAKLLKGIYYCSLTVIGDSVRTPVFEARDCTLLVK